MINAYKLAKSWHYLSIIPSALLFLMIWSLFIFGGGSLDMPLGAWVFLIIVTVFTGWMIFGALVSRIIISPIGIETVTLGIRVDVAWDKVEKIDMTHDGFVNLVFKEPIYKSKFANTFLGLLGYDKIIQLSPFIEDVATSTLLGDIAKYVPHSNIPEFVAQQKRPTQTYQNAGMIGLYYFGCFIVWALFAIAFQKGTVEFLASFGFPNIDRILTFVGLSLVMGLFVNTISLLKSYNVEFAKLDGNELAHKARAYYLIPLVIVLISSFVSIGIWTITQTPSDFETPLMFLIGAVSLPVSSKFERFLFRDSID